MAMLRKAWFKGISQGGFRRREIVCEKFVLQVKKTESVMVRLKRRDLDKQQQMQRGGAGFLPALENDRVGGCGRVETKRDWVAAERLRGLVVN
jgi:hypothetical protein